MKKVIQVWNDTRMNEYQINTLSISIRCSLQPPAVPPQTPGYTLQLCVTKTWLYILLYGCAKMHSWHLNTAKLL